ncbi:MAG TPA: DUF1579 domain-containing protein [Candidatus Krumholzibacteria bacterium]|nr:DUF1579 domain-containing protein [Candidatus Krumholzibacteria bacterium]
MRSGRFPIWIISASLVAVTTLSAMHSRAQAPDPAAIAAQKDAMKPLSMLDGVWRGPAWTLLPSGRHEVTQTERVGPFLDGAVRVMEGRGYDADGTVTFNAFATLSFDPATKKYTLHSYAMGRTGDFTVTPTADGYMWEIPAGPMTIRYTATIKDGTWHEVGERVMQGKDPVQFFEMNLKRVGDTDWPAAGAIPPK